MGRAARYNPRTEAVAPSPAERARATELKRQATLLSRANGIMGANISIDTEKRNNCGLTQDGIVLTINPTSIENLAGRQWFGTQGLLPLKAADFLVIMHSLRLAQDYLDPTFSLSTATKAGEVASTARFFTDSVNEIAADGALSKIPYARRFMTAYVSRRLTHVFDTVPLHIQFLTALKILLHEDSPAIKMADLVERLLFNEDRAILPRMHEELLGGRHSYEERHRIARQILYPTFKELLDRDMRKYAGYQFTFMYDQFAFHGESSDEEFDNKRSIPTREVKNRTRNLYHLIERQDIDQLINDRDESSPSEDKEGIGNTSLALPREASRTVSTRAAEEERQGYAQAVAFWHNTIEQVAEVFVKLASPKESVAVPRYASRKAFEGSRLNPRSMPETIAQLDTGIAQPIWQPVKRVIRSQDLQFSGLDVYLLLDVSGSMQGKNAEYAGAMSVCLMEGLILARHKVELDPLQKTVDVRIQLLAFGSGWAELTPLGPEPSPHQKQATLYNLLNPQSDHTMINGVLKYIRDSAKQSPGREVISIIVSDGLFADNLMAFKTVQNMPKNCFVCHINIGGFAGVPITLDYETVDDPVWLPTMLERILSSYLERRQL